MWWTCVVDMCGGHVVDKRGGYVVDMRGGYVVDMCVDICGYRWWSQHDSEALETGLERHSKANYVASYGR